MMMSGFILTYGTLTSSEPQNLAPVLTFVKARLLSIYPLYIAGLFSALALQLNIHGLASFEQTEFIVSLALLQAWIPRLTERVLQPQCWFLSCIVPYWMLHNMLYKKISVLSMQQLLHLLVFCWLAPLGLLLCLATLFHDSEWYLDHHWQDTRGWTDMMVVVLKFHPFCYLHIYVFGIATACLYVKMEGSTTTFDSSTRQLRLGDAANGWGHVVQTSCMNYGVSLGYAGLLTVFVASKWVSVGLSLRLGFLAPLHGLTMIGMIKNHDPLSRFFSYSWLPALGNLSYPQYIFQFICFSVWGRAFASFGFWAFLAACAVVGYVAIQKPLKELNGPLRPKACGLLAIGITPLLLGGLGQLSSYSDKLYPPPPPSFDVSYVNGAIDTQLVIDETAHSSMSPDDEASFFYINPSLLFEPRTQQLVAVVRKHRMRVEKMAGLEVEVKYLTSSGIQTTSGKVTYQRIIWESDIGISDVDPTSYRLLHRLKKLAVFPSQASFCEIRPTLSPHNQTMAQLVADGPQDPRLFISPTSELWLSFFSYPITSSSGEACSSRTGGKVYHAPVPSHFQIDLVDGGPWSSPLSTNATQLIGIDRVDHHHNGPHVNDTSFPVISTSFPQDYVTLRSEKNWLAFTCNATLYYITDMHPFTIVRVVNGSKVESAISYYYPLFTSTQMHHPDIFFHGGANPILMAATDIRPSFYLGVFHTLKNGTYINYAFEFMDEKYLFAIIRVSRPLPLRLVPRRDASVSRPLGFVSGLTQHPDTKRIVFSYGSSNVESRVLSMSLETLEELFT
jgi:peptidoglycan/LPS O-acetylase OafA/YrhL